MPSIQTSLKMFDGFSNPLQKVITAMESTLGVMDELSNTVDRPNRVAEAFNTARRDISLAQMEIENTVQAQQNFNNQVNRSSRGFDDLVNKAKQLFGAYAMFQGGKKFITGADEFAGTYARLQLINDNLQTVDELNKKIFQSAQRARSEYYATMDIVGKLGITAGDAFKNNDEIIHFTELMSKSFKIAGASATEQKSAMYQLTQAMAAGKLQGDEFRAINENAPLLAQSIADVMGVTRGELKKLSSDGVITADIIKAALFTSADDINTKFEKIPMTFGAVITNITNTLNQTLQPSFQRFINWLDSDTGQMFFLGIASAMIAAFNVAGFLINAIVQIVSIFTDYWPIISPIIWGIIGALIVYNSTMGIAWLATMKDVGAKVAHTIASWAETAAIIALTIAQDGLNAALAMCPLTWIIIAIVALVAIIYAAVGAINKFAGTSISATGVIVGAFLVLGAIIGNILIGTHNLIMDIVAEIWNCIANFVEFFANVFIDPIGSIKRLFIGLADSVLGIIEMLAGAMDTLFGSSMADSVEGWRSSLQSWADENVGEAKIKIQRLDGDSVKLDRFNYGKAYNAANKWGQNMEQKFGSMLPTNDIPTPPFEVETPEFGGFNVDSVGSIEDDVDISEEDIELLRDLASMEAVNQYATLAPNIKVEFGDVKETADVDKVAKRIGEILEEEIAVSTEVVYS